nr:hypothetical protein [Agrococcus baldri]
MLDPFSDLGDRQCSRSGQVDQPLLLPFQLCKLLPQLRLRIAVFGQQVVDRASQCLAHAVKGVDAQPLTRHYFQKAILNLFDADPRHRALLALLGSTDEVLVGATVAVGLAIDQAAGSARLRAMSAPQQPLQVVMMRDVAIALSLPLIQDLLNLEERLLTDQRLVTTDVELALVAHHPGVVRVAKYQRQTTDAHGLGRSRRGWPRRQAVFDEEVAQLRDGVPPSRVLLESESHEGCSFGIEVDSVDEPTAVLLANIEIAELRPADRAALLNLVRHLDLHVLAVHPNLDFVHDVGDGLHGVRHVARPELLLRGDEPNPLFQQLTLGDGRIGEVAEDARAHIYDHKLHLRVGFDVAQQLLELGALGYRLRRLPRLDELFDNGRAQLSDFAHRLHALRGDAVAVLVKVGSGVQLPWCRDAQVGDGLRHAQLHVFGRGARRQRHQMLESIE